MRRRRFVTALVTAPTASALLAQQVQQTGPAQPAPGIPLNPAQPVQPPASATRELPKLDPSFADDVANGVPKFFSPAQFAALRKVCDMLMPSVEGKAGALTAQAPEFLDFLIGQSPADRQEIYRTGLDSLNSQAKTRFNKPFADLGSAEADQLFDSLRQAWTFDVPSDPVARFLRVAKADVRTATINSREFSKMAGAGGDRRMGGGLYWQSLD